MRQTLLLIVVCLSLGGIPKVLRAQPAARSAVTDTTVAMDTWLNSPTRIVLTPTQRIQLDSLRGRMRAETAEIQRNLKAGLSKMEFVSRMADVSEKYHNRVRALLTPRQQVTFDENFEASAVRIDRPPPSALSRTP